MVKLSVLLCLLASAVLSTSEPLAALEGMALAQSESTDKVRELHLVSSRLQSIDFIKS
jgi:hypothetical protein